MKLKLMAVSIGLFSLTSPLLAIETADVEEISMHVIEDGSAVEIDETRILALPPKASLKAIQRAQEREGFGLSKANETRKKHENDSDENLIDDIIDGDIDVARGSVEEKINEHSEENKLAAQARKEEAIEQAEENRAEAQERSQDAQPRCKSAC